MKDFYVVVDTIHNELESNDDCEYLMYLKEAMHVCEGLKTYFEDEVDRFKVAKLSFLD